MKIFLVDPFNQKNLLKDELFNSPFEHLYLGLKELGITLNTYDQKSLETADKIIFFNHNKDLLKKCDKLKISKDKRELILWEPEVVMPDQYKKNVWNMYGKVVCFREDLEKKYNIAKINWPQGQSVRKSVPGFKERKLLTLINANKFSYIKGELYSLRRKVIRFFEEKAGDDFHLYGKDWNKNPFLNPKTLAYYGLMAIKNKGLIFFCYDFLASFFIFWPSYKGEVKDKYLVLDAYKFTICFENEATYITEKIFDSLSSGSIPIYKGPLEIKSIVPQDCYINYDEFNSLDELYKFLNSMSEEEFTRRQNKIIEYMNGDFEKMRPKAVFQRLSKVLSE